MFYISGIEFSLSNFLSSGLNQSINWDTITDEMEQKNELKFLLQMRSKTKKSQKMKK